MKQRRLAYLAVLVLLLSPALVQAQTASSGLVAGTVYDKTGAVVPSATVELKDLATNRVYTQTTNEGGQYLFSTVMSGAYKMAVRKDGFKEWTTTLRVSVAKSYDVDVTLELGGMAETVEVAATVGAELQQTDATVGIAIGGDQLKYLPTPNRSVAALLILQPLVQPIGRGLGTDIGGQVAGARSDQSTMLIDGGDATSDTEASGAYNTGFSGEIRPMIPVPAESIEEFRVGTTNPNASFGRSQGGQVVMVTKRGTNSIHGSAYWYHQNDNLNANSWDLNTAGISKPELKDNRYGFTLGGPIFKDRLWAFGHFEGRKFPQTSTFTRVVPTPELRSGIMRFRDSTGAIVTYNFNPANGPLAALCGTVPGACDPRGIGTSAVSLADMALLPAGTPGVTGIGDGLNLVGYRGVVNRTRTEKFSVVRVDYRLTDKWNLFVSGRYQSLREPGSQQIDVSGISGCSAPCATRVNPLQPRYYVAGIDGQITPRLLSETRVSWFRHWWEWGTRAPFPQVSGTAAALSLAGEGTGAGGSTKIADPVNIDTQNARSRIWNGKDTFISENLTWIRGSHNFQFGGTYRLQNIYHQRTDKVTGGLSTGPIFYLNAGSFFLVPATYRPPTCGGAVTTNCLTSTADRNRWNNFYAALMGIPDRSAQLLTRDGDLNAQPLGTPLEAQVRIHALEGFVQDIWRFNPQLTLTLGLTYQVQRPPTEAKGRQMVPVFAASGSPIDMNSFFENREAAAVTGTIFNPSIAYTPVRHVAGRKYVTNIDWNNIGPRLAFAWHPSQSLFGLGNGKMVLRGGWSVTYTRMNGVGLVMTPVLGVGTGQILSCNGPRIGGVCAGSSDPTNAFRIGPDGNGSTILPSTLPVAPAQIPFPVSAPYGETRSFMIDPGMKLGYSHSFDLTVQRELPWNLLLEVGYVGRLGRNLTQNVDYNAVPFMFKDTVSGQTLASAFDTLAQAVRNGTAIVAQPWFENMALAGACTAGLINNTNPGCPTGPAPAATNFANVTSYLVSQFNFELSTGDLSTVMLSRSNGIDILRFNNGQQPIDNIQVQINNLTSHGGKSDFHAGFIALHKRMSHGLTFDMNYTLGHSLDVFGLNQENTQFSFASPFRRDYDRAPSIFDRRHVFNTHWYYELPFGKGKAFSTDNAVVNRIVGGWHIAGIWTASSGLPLCVYGGFSYGSPNVQNPCLLPAAGFKNPGAEINNVGGNLNIFKDPTAVMNSFRYPLMTQDGRFGFGALRGLPMWNVDLSIGKKTSITERVSLVFVADFLNAFNHPLFSDPSTDGTDPSTFGVIGSTFNLPRYVQLSFRVEF